MELRLPPDTIYKYCSPKNAQMILRDRTFMYSPPSAFNDPLDCHEELIDWTLSNQGIEKIIERKFSDRNRKERRLNKHLLKTQKSRTIKEYKKAAKKAKESLGICCFSIKPDNPVMWSHYAKNHTGLCIKYSPPSIRNWPPNYVCHKVAYPLEIVKINLFESGEKALLHWVLTKAPDWKYEKEVREIYMMSNGVKLFPPSSLKKIIFGYKASKPFKREIFEVVKKEYPHISKFTEMDLNINTFSLEEIPSCL